MGSSTRWGRRPVERVAAVALLTAALVLNMATPLMAHPLDDDWSIGGDLIGYCGDSAGGWVMAVQGNLITHWIDLGNYGPYNNGVDGQFGSSTYSGVRTWQDIHGLSVDGCVGPQTWDNMAATNVHRTYLFTSGSLDYWAIQNHGPSREYRYVEDPCTATASDISTGTGMGRGDHAWYYVQHDVERKLYWCT